jgi:hypothetical protein
LPVFRKKSRPIAQSDFNGKTPHQNHGEDEKFDANFANYREWERGF